MQLMKIINARQQLLKIKNSSHTSGTNKKYKKDVIRELPPNCHHQQNHNSTAHSHHTFAILQHVLHPSKEKMKAFTTLMTVVTVLVGFTMAAPAPDVSWNYLRCGV